MPTFISVILIKSLKIKNLPYPQLLHYIFPLPFFNFIAALLFRIDRIVVKMQRFLRNEFIQNQQMSHKYNKWTQYQDNVLTELLQKHGTGNWSLIAREMRDDYEIPRRNGKQCRERWFNQLHQANQHRKWTEQEDRRLIQIQAILGTKWMELSHHFPGRSDNNVKNHFYSIVRKGIRKMCRCANITTTSMNVYSIKPFVLSKIFIQGASQANEIELDLSQDHEQGHMLFSKQDYFEITQIITRFIFDNKQSHSDKPHKNKIIEILHKVMQINSFYNRESSSDFNSHSPESFSDSEKREALARGEVSTLSEGRIVQEGKEGKREREMKQQSKSESDEMSDDMQEQFNPNGIFSHKRIPDKKQTRSSFCQISKSFDQIKPQKQAFQELEIKYPSMTFLRRDSELSLNGNFFIHLPDYTLNEQSALDPQLKLFSTPRKSDGDSIFSKYLQ